MEPGIYKDMSYRNYDAEDAISRRDLVLDRNWERTRWAKNNPKEDTESMILGRALHAVVLDPASADRDFYFCEDFSRATKEGKERWKQVETEAAGRTIVRGKETFDITGAVVRNPGAQGLLSGGVAEVSVFWKEDIDYCKARLDYLKDGLVVELKTTTNASPRAFIKELVRYGYHYQLAWYRRGISKFMPVKGCAIVAVEKTPPYCVATYYLTNEDLDKAEKIMLQRLDEFRVCQRDGWAGYSEVPQKLELPSWAFGDDSTNDDSEDTLNY